MNTRQHEFWLGRAADETNRFVCGSTKNLSQAHGDTPRAALVRYLENLDSQARAIRRILVTADPEMAGDRLTDASPLRTREVLLSERQLDDSFESVMKCIEK